ncbi:MAG: lysophospholipid acyltransferase family protein [Mariprofundaceae bacterium]|nr:lysophospholipid acyltransferase family protein [Mariprofundaceae bacterium]
MIVSRPFGYAASWFWAKAWTHSVLFSLRLICGIRIKIEGQEHLPKEACVLMAKHQSALETIAMPMLIPPYVWILKRELFYIPFFGWTLWVLDAIAIRRNNPREAIKQVNKQGIKFLKQGKWVVVFPEGTRSNLGSAGDYKPGGISLAQKANVGILPLAHNAGACWSKQAFVKKPGTVTLRFLPFISAQHIQDGKRSELLKQIQSDIEHHSLELAENSKIQK